MLCTCPPEPPINYGRAWIIRGEAWKCSVCGGEPRPEQLAVLDDAVDVAERQRMAREAGDPNWPAAGRR